MAEQHSLGMGELPFGNKYEMIAAAHSGEPVNPVTQPFTPGSVGGQQTVTDPQAATILGPKALSGNRLGYRGQK